jgi:hypothetical protein
VNVDQSSTEANREIRIQVSYPSKAANSTETPLSKCIDEAEIRGVDDRIHHPKIFTHGFRLAISSIVTVNTPRRYLSRNSSSLKFRRFRLYRPIVRDAHRLSVPLQRGFTLGLETHTDALYRENMPIVKIRWRSQTTRATRSPRDRPSSRV